MDAFNSLIWDLEKLLEKHKEIHFIRPKNYHEEDLREAAFVIQEVVGKEVVVPEDVATWLDRYQFYRLGSGKQYDC